MAHYAFINDNNIVTEVIVGCEENELVEGVEDWEVWYGAFRGMTCKRTSYNTLGNTHHNGGTPFRKNYAGIGHTWDEQRDAFIPPRPEGEGWVLNEDTCLWENPDEETETAP